MKEKSLQIDTKNNEEHNSLSCAKENNINKNNFSNSLISFKSSYNELKESNTIKLNIIKSKISIEENFEFNKDINKIISFVKKIIEKYKNRPFPILSNFDKNFTDLESLFVKDFEMNLKSLYSNKECPSIHSSNFDINKLFGVSDLSEILNDDLIYPQNYNINFFDDDISKNLEFPIIKNNSITENLFLNKKRKINEERKKNNKKNYVFIYNKNKTNSINEGNLNSNEERVGCKNKKIYFRLSKYEKGKSKYRTQKDFSKEKKQAGRKKKNSGEKGTHDKFSKDNMMRKLKNKVMESARKLINKMIKSEAGNELKNFKEIRKIEGIFSQELNIKFNFWFYFQKLKDIFQFKMSSKYSKGDLKSNSRLINKIYSIDKPYKFQKTIELLEMRFHEYYHDIFLGEKKNWYEYYDIKEKENKYQLDFFLKNGDSKIDKEDNKYRETISNLARKYELFFLKKNPRLSGNKKNEEKESDAKQMIKSITNDQFEFYKYKFMVTGSFYVPDIATIYNKNLKENRKLFSKRDLVNANININNGISIENKSNLNNFNKTNEIIKKNDIIENKIVNNNFIDKMNNTNIDNKSKSIGNKNNTSQEKQNKHLFDVSNNHKKIFEITNLNQIYNKKVNEEKKIQSPFIPKNSYCLGLVSSSNNINFEKDDSKQKMEREIQTDNFLNPEESSQNIEILISDNKFWV